jgi:hypothetical protein
LLDEPKVKPITLVIKTFGDPKIEEPLKKRGDTTKSEAQKNQDKFNLMYNYPKFLVIDNK